ncbi:MAG: DUF4355 domain-containing protein, partial [Raoultibacter sp.]
MTRQNFANLDGKTGEEGKAQDGLGEGGAEGKEGGSDDGSEEGDGEKGEKSGKPDEASSKKQEPAKKYTEADVDRIVKDRIAREREKADEAVKLADMNAAQKAEYEAEKLRKENADLKREKTIFEMKRESRKELSDTGINVSDDLLELLVTDDAAKTKAAVGSFGTLFTEAVEKA